MFSLFFKNVNTLVGAGIATVGVAGAGVGISNIKVVRLLSVVVTKTISLIEIDKKEPNKFEFYNHFIWFLLKKRLTFKSFITLTFPSGKKDDFLGKFKRFLKRFRYKFASTGSFYYIYVYELTEKGLFHIHMLINKSFVGGFYELKKMWASILLNKPKFYNFSNEELVSLNYQPVTTTAPFNLINYIFKTLFNSSSLERINKFLLENSTSSNKKINFLLGGTDLFVKFFKETIIYLYLSKSNEINSGRWAEIKKNPLQFIKQRLGVKLEDSVMLNLVQMQINNELNYLGDVLVDFDLNVFYNALFNKNLRARTNYALNFQFANQMFEEFQTNINLVLRYLDEQIVSTRKPYKGMLTVLKKSLENNEPMGFYFLKTVFLYLLRKNMFIEYSNVAKFYIGLKNLFITFLKKSEFNSLINSDLEEFIKNEAWTTQGLSIGVRVWVVIKKGLKNILNDINIVVESSEYNMKKKDILFDDKELSLEKNDFSDSEQDLLQLTGLLKLPVLKKKLSISDQYLNSIDKSLSNKLAQRLKAFSIQEPMYVEPVDWTWGPLNEDEELKKKNHGYINCNNNYTGGFLLNDFILRVPLLKRHTQGEDHSLSVHPEVIHTLNALQKVPFKVDVEVLNYLYTTIRKYNPDYLSDNKMKDVTLELKKLKLNLSNENKNFSELKKQLDLTKTHITYKNHMIRVAELRDRISNLNEKLGKSLQIKRVFEYLKDLKKDYSLYYPYNLDFRGRVYPIPMETHPMGNKLAKAVINFTNSYSFDFDVLKKYLTCLYYNVGQMAETEILEVFNTEIIQIVSCFNEPNIIKRIYAEAEEPFLFIRACFEYHRYQRFKELNPLSEYKSNFPVYMDATASGPQIICLLFTLTEFAEYLNLTGEQSEYTQTRDFYVDVLKNWVTSDELFISNLELQQNLKKDSNQLVEFLKLLRKVFKKPIMTQFYGVTPFRVRKDVRLKMKEYKSKLELYSKSLFIGEDIPEQEEKENILCTSFLKFVSNLKLFQLKELLNKLVDELGMNSLNWGVLNKSFIKMKYKKLKKHVFKIKIGKFQELKTTGYTEVKNKISSKQKTASMANVIHSIDAQIMMSVLNKLKVSAIPIHDCWGVPSGHINELRELIRDEYKGLIANKRLYRFFVKTITEHLKKVTSDAVVQSYEKFLDKNIHLGDLEGEDLNNSLYFITFR